MEIIIVIAAVVAIVLGGLAIARGQGVHITLGPLRLRVPGRKPKDLERSAAEQVQVVERELSQVTRSLRKLASDTEKLSGGRPPNYTTPLLKLLARDLEAAAERSSALVVGEMRLTTSRLYEEIYAAYRKARRVKTVDQDLMRWAELMDPKDPANINTFNWSLRLAGAAQRGAERSDPLELDRVFVFNSHGKDAIAEPKVIRDVLMEVEKWCRDKRLRNWVLDVGWPREATDRDQRRQAARQAAERQRDFVLAEINRVTVLFKENIKWADERDAHETDSRIVTRPKDVAEAEETFNEIKEAAVPIDEYLRDLDDRIASEEPHAALP